MDNEKELKNQDKEKDVEAQYIEVVAAPILWVVAKAVVNAVVTFLTMQFMKNWWEGWKKKKADEAAKEEEV